MKWNESNGTLVLLPPLKGKLRRPQKLQGLLKQLTILCLAVDKRSVVTQVISQRTITSQSQKAGIDEVNGVSRRLRMRLISRGGVEVGW